MRMYNLLKYSDISLKESGCLWQYYRHKPALNKAGNIIDFPVNDLYLKKK